MCPVRGVAAQVGCVVTAIACSPCMSLGVAQEPDRAAIMWWRGDGLRAMYPALYKGNKTTPKGCAVAQ